MISMQCIAKFLLHDMRFQLNDAMFPNARWRLGRCPSFPPLFSPLSSESPIAYRGQIQFVCKPTLVVVVVVREQERTRPPFLDIKGAALGQQRRRP